MSLPYNQVQYNIGVAQKEATHGGLQLITMKTCIFCLREKADTDFNKEHVFPESIGGSLTINDVCTTCNSYLGRCVDNHLVDHLFIKSERMTHQLSSKGRSIPNPFGIGIMDDGTKVQFTPGENGNNKLYILPKKIDKKEESSKVTLNIRLSEEKKDELLSITNKIRKRMGLPKWRKEDLYKHTTTTHTKIINPEVTLDFFYDDIEYRRAILKIAYELGYYWFGDEFLNNEDAELIRQCIMHDEPSVKWYEKFQLRPVIGRASDFSVYDCWSDAKDSHIAYVSPLGGRVYCFIKIFDVFAAFIPLSSKYILPKNNPHFHDSLGNFIAVNYKTGKCKECTLAEESSRVNKGR